MTTWKPTLFLDASSDEPVFRQIAQAFKREIRRGRLGAAVSRFALSGDILAALHGLEADRGDSAPPATGLGICQKGGEGLAVGGAAPAVVVRGLAVRALGS